jgi:uncharacterized OB-fold protein
MIQVLEFTTKKFIESIANGIIKGSKCTSCGKICLPPRPICPSCSGTNLEWKELSPTGKIKTFTVVNVPLSNMVGHSPYTVAVIQLDDGPCISGNILDVKRGEDLSVGARVVAEFVKRDNDAFLHFRLI